MPDLNLLYRLVCLLPLQGDDSVLDDGFGNLSSLSGKGSGKKNRGIVGDDDDDVRGTALIDCMIPIQCAKSAQSMLE